MRLHIIKPWAKKTVSTWNHMSALERLHFILTHEDIFLRANLVRPGELLAAKVTPESCREYIIEREESPFFAILDIKKPLDAKKQSILSGMLTVPSS